MDVTYFESQSLGSGRRQFVQCGSRLRPRKLIVKTLVIVCLQASIARRLAVLVIEVLNGPLGNAVKVFGDPREIARASQTGIDECERQRW